MSTPTWGVSASRYEQMYLDAAKRFGVEDFPPPILGYIAAGQRVLDLGCATGRQARLLCDRGCTVVGVEVDTEAAALATAWCERVIVCDLDVTDLAEKLGDDRFDTIAAGDVLEHLRDPVRVLGSLIPLLRADGRVVASLPNVAHGSVRLALLSGAFPYDDAGLLDRTHLRFFTRSTIEGLFTSAGYTIEQLEPIEVPIDQAVPYDRTVLPRGIEAAVAAMPDARTFQFVVVARPTEPDMSRSGQRESGEAPGRPSEREAMIRSQADALRSRDQTIIELRRVIDDLERRLEQDHGRGPKSLWRRLRG